MTTFAVRTKLEGLRALRESGFAVPSFAILEWQDMQVACTHHDPGAILKEKIGKLLVGAGIKQCAPLSIRSASEREGGRQASATGHFLSLNGVASLGDAAYAALEIWKDHKSKTGGDPQCNVIVQETICTMISGVLHIEESGRQRKFFSEFFWGSCRNVASGHVRPFSLLFNGANWSCTEPSVGEVERFFVDSRLIAENSQRDLPGALLKLSINLPVRNLRLFERLGNLETLLYGRVLSLSEDLVNSLKSELQKLVSKTPSTVGLDLEIEWGIDKNFDLWVFQIKPLAKISEPQAASNDKRRAVGKIVNGLPGSPGEHTGKLAHEGESVCQGDVYRVYEATTRNLDDILKAGAIISTKGGRMSHVASLCRELGKPCVTGVIHRFESGCEVTVNGTCGRVLIN